MAKKITSPDDFARRMRNVAKQFPDDPERQHILMDNLMCTLLTRLGYTEGVEVFNNTHRWYA